MADHTVTATDPELTGFQLRILAVLAEETRYGLAIKEELEDYYGETVNHGRLYPNLNTLVEKGYVDKSERDKRTNDYAITSEGRLTLQDEIGWLADRVDGHELVHADSVRVTDGGQGGED